MKLQQKKRVWILILFLPFLSGILFPKECCRENPFRKASLRRYDPNAWQDPKDVLKQAIQARRAGEKMRKEFLAANRVLQDVRQVPGGGVGKIASVHPMVISYRYLLGQGKPGKKRQDEKKKNKTYLVKTAEERLFTNPAAQPFSP